MILWIAILLSLIRAIFTPYCNGLYHTSLWYAKISTPKELEFIKEVKHFQKVTQAALMEGWTSTIVVVYDTLFVIIVILGFIYT